VSREETACREADFFLSLSLVLQLSLTPSSSSRINLLLGFLFLDLKEERKEFLKLCSRDFHLGVGAL
jgi:hypothetical protein